MGRNKKSKKLYYFGLICILLLAAGFYLYKNANRAVAPDRENEKTAMGANTPDQTGMLAQKSAENTATSAPAQKPKPPVQSGASTPPTSGVYSSGSEMDALGPDILVAEVVYDGTKFLPQSLNIKVGDIVIFKNSGTTDFWPASNPHPTHTDYPEFDAKAAVPPGKTFQFKFLKPGSWGYHNHLNPSATGIINVAK